MTCNRCKPLCATTEGQLAYRLRNLQTGGAPHACEQCSGTDWATSREMISATPKARAGWRKLLDTPRWRTLAVLQLVAAVLMFGGTLMTDTKWIVIVDAVFAGLNLGLAYHSWRAGQLFSLYERLSQAFNSMSDLNRALIENRVGVIVAGMHDDDDAPVAPNRLN